MRPQYLKFNRPTLKHGYNKNLFPVDHIANKLKCVTLGSM